MSSASKSKSFLLYSLLFLLSVHFVKEEFSYYLAIVAFVYFVSFLVIFNQKEIVFNRSATFIFYLIFLIALLWVSIWTLNFFNNESVQIKFNIFSFINACGRLFLMPILVLLLINFVNNKNDFDRMLILFIVVFCIGSLSMLLQQFIGGIGVFGTYGPPRFTGLDPFPSSLGNITVYGSGVAIAIIICLLNDKVNLILKSIILSILVLGVFLTMQKSALINLLIGLSFSILFLRLKALIFIATAILLIFLSIFVFLPDILLNVLSLFANTLGLKIEHGGTSVFHAGIYDSIFDRFIDRQVDWLKAPNNIGEILFGFGLPGGTDAMGYSFHTSMWHSYDLSPQVVMGTTHNSYLDLYQMGGLFFPLIFITLVLSVIFELANRWLNTNDNISKIMMISNIVFLINCFVANGILFHPIISFPFWLSVAYVLKPININQTNE